MSKVIRAFFDSTDMAEFAMIRLKRDGITIEAYDLISSDSKTGTNGLQAIVFPYTADYGYGAEPLHTEISRVQPFGGVLYFTENNTREQRSLDDDIHSSDVRTIIRVPDRQAEEAVGILRSCHGYRMRIL